MLILDPKHSMRMMDGPKSKWLNVYGWMDKHVNSLIYKQVIKWRSLSEMKVKEI